MRNDDVHVYAEADDNPKLTRTKSRLRRSVRRKVEHAYAYAYEHAYDDEDEHDGVQDANAHAFEKEKPSTIESRRSTVGRALGGATVFPGRYQVLWVSPSNECIGAGTIARALIGVVHDGLDGALNQIVFE